jgi:RsiW-degrading membrane proteinase PrsW (M82 family)
VHGQRILEPVLLVPGQHVLIGGTDLVLEALPAPQQGEPVAPPTTAPSPASPGPQPPPSVAQVASIPLAAPRESPILLWLKLQRGRAYWRVFLIALSAYIVATIVLNDTENLHLVPMVLLIGSIVVPISFVRFCVDEGAFVDMPIRVVGLTFVSGAVLGLILAAILEQQLLTSGSITFGTFVIVGLCEESAKVAAVVWFFRDKQLHSELDGVVLGAAAGMGFAALETAGYGFYAFLTGFYHDLVRSQIPSHAVGAGTDSMTHELILRMTLAFFGHGVWTAIVCAAIWRDRGGTVFRPTQGVLAAFGIAVGLHAIWDWYAFIAPSLGAEYFGLIVVGLVGLFVLRFFIREGLARQALGPMAPPPPPLVPALLEYVSHPGAGAHLFTPSESQPLAQALASAAPVRPPPAPPPPSTATDTAPAPQLPPMPVDCPRCARTNRPGSRFCSQCGSPLSS